jgi:hypothetical protein
METIDEMKNKEMDAGLLTREQYEYIRRQVIARGAVMLEGREFLPILKIPSSAQAFTFREIPPIREVASGQVPFVAKGADFPKYDVKSAEGYQIEHTLPLFKIGRKFEITREDLISSQSSGVPLNTVYAEAAARDLAMWEDVLVWHGAPGTPVGYFPGLLNMPKKKIVCSDAPWDMTLGESVYKAEEGKTIETSGSLTKYPFPEVQEQVAKAIYKLNEDGYKPDTLLVPPLAMMYLQKKDVAGNTVASAIERLGITVKPVQRLDPKYVNRDGSSKISGLDALLFQSGPDIAQFVVADDWQIEEHGYTDRQTYEYLLFERFTVAVYQPGAFVKMEGILTQDTYDSIRDSIEPL